MSHDAYNIAACCISLRCLRDVSTLILIAATCRTIIFSVNTFDVCS
jgi:hypothetical protein